MAVKKNRKRPPKRRALANAVRSHTRRLRSAHAAGTSLTPNQPALAKTGPRSVPADLVEDQPTGELDKGPSVMLVITVLAVLFISLIAWFVARMPAK